MPTRTDAERIEAVLTGRDPVTGEACDRLDPAALDGDEWQAVFFACNEAGVPEATVDAWNATDPSRYDQRKNATRYRSLDPGKAGNAGMGSFVNVCKAHGVRVPVSGGNQGGTRREASESTTRPQSAPAEERKPNRLQQCREYVKAAFMPGDVILLEDSRREPDRRGKHAPDGQPRFVGYAEFMGALDAAEKWGATDPDGALEGVLGPLSGHGVFVGVNPYKEGSAKRGTAYVAEFRHIVAEGDESPLPEQERCFRALGLPCSTLTDSGNKSVHALVRVDAPDADSYRERFNLVAGMCEAEGVKLDPNCKDASRLTRLAGAMRDGKPQRLVESRPGACWDGYVSDALAEAAREKAEKAKGSTLPMPTDLSDGWGVDRRAPDLIEGALRCGHLGFMFSAPKLGKSWAVIQLGVAVATGGAWLGLQCKRGRVLYVDYELAAESSDYRIYQVAEAARGLQSALDREEFDGLVKANFRPLHLRGKMKSTAEYAEHVKRVCSVTGPYDLVIIDPFYRFSDADENSAKEVAGVTGHLYSIAEDTGASIMVVHHYPKGKAGQRDQIDRFSGSGVLARSPDCLFDFAPIDVDEEEDVELADALAGATALEVTPILRDHIGMKCFRVVRKHPLMLRCDSDLLNRAQVHGAGGRSAENRRNMKRAQGREQDRKDHLLEAAWNDTKAEHFDLDGLECATVPDLEAVVNHDAVTGLGSSEKAVRNAVKGSNVFRGKLASDMLSKDRRDDLGLRYNTTVVWRKEDFDRLRAEREAEKAEEAPPAPDAEQGSLELPD